MSSLVPPINLSCSKVLTESPITFQPRHLWSSIFVPSTTMKLIGRIRKNSILQDTWTTAMVKRRESTPVFGCMSSSMTLENYFWSLPVTDHLPLAPGNVPQGTLPCTSWGPWRRCCFNNGNGIFQLTRLIMTVLRTVSLRSHWVCLEIWISFSARLSSSLHIPYHTRVFESNSLDVIYTGRRKFR